MSLPMLPARDYSLLKLTCPSCGGLLRLARTVAGTNGLVELQTFSCRESSLVDSFKLVAPA